MKPADHDSQRAVAGLCGCYAGPPGLISHFITEAIANALRSNSAAMPPSATTSPDEAPSAEPKTQEGASTTSQD